MLIAPDEQLVGTRTNQRQEIIHAEAFDFFFFDVLQ